VRVAIVDKFRKYPNWDSCIRDRAGFFRDNPRYAKCFAEKSGEGWARAVAAAGYATDPKYADSLIAVMGNRPGGRNLAQYDV
jgi:flagellar protein FlgJ